MSSCIVCKSKGNAGSKYTQSAASRTSGGEGTVLGAGKPQSRTWAVVAEGGELRVILRVRRGRMVETSVRCIRESPMGWRDNARLGVYLALGASLGRQR